MPTVPSYGAPQVQRTGLRGGEDQSRADIDALGGAQARQMAQAAQGLGQAADAMQRIQDRGDQTALLDADAKIKASYAEWALEESKNTGVAAKGATERAREWWKTNADNLGKDIQNPLVKKRFEAAVSAQTSASVQHFGSHENQQLEVVAAQTADSSVKGSIKLAAEIPTDANIALQKAAIVGAMQAYGGNKWSPEVMKEKTDTAISGMHTAVFNNLFARDPIGAETYYKANRKEIDPTQYDQIETKLKAGVADAEGANGARSVIGEFAKSLKGSDPLPQADIDAKLVDMFGGKPETLKAARTELDRQTALRDRDVAKTEANALKGINAAYAQGTPLAALKRLPEWSQLSGTAQVQMQEHITDRNHMLWARSIEDRNRLQREQELKYAPEVLRWSQPEVLAGMTEDQIMQKLPTIGLANTERLLQQRKALMSSQAKLQDAKLDADTFNDAFLQATGINPKTKLTPEYADAVVRARNAVESSIASLQGNKGRELTRQEKDAEVRRIVGAKVIEKGFFSDSEKPEIMLNDKQVRDALVEVSAPGANGQPVRTKIPVSSIPVNEFSAVQARLRKEGSPYSTADVVQAWHEFTLAKKGKK